MEGYVWCVGCKTTVTLKRHCTWYYLPSLSYTAGEHLSCILHGRTARETWERARISLPPAGFSSNLVFLNLHHLITFSKKCDGSVETSPRFPWILWKNWKARNAFCFEQVSYEPSPRQRRLDKLAVLLWEFLRI